ncbi:MAG: type I-D CRISPR-associated helicase Cas3' [Fischerella sp. CENA71]|nr:type I-D CRISPR-associated helicase Cas3' [Fischerella sp. CENA71]
MSNYSISLKPVYSQTVPTPNGVNLPDGLSLVWHQVETLKALQHPDNDVVIDVAMTGDGKTLIAYLQSLQGETPEGFCYTIALYPTNELARDQEAQVKRYIEQFKPNNDPRISRLSGAELEIYAESEGIKKWEAIATRIQESEIIQTNPDIFHYLHQHAYLTPKDSPNKLWSPLDTKFDLFIFDEFHVFAAPQIASVINTMLLIRHTNRRKKFLFLSATPDEQLIELLQKAGFKPPVVIDPVQKNKYQFPDTLEQSQKLQEDGWRQVSRQIELTFIELEPTYKASETWLWDNRYTILEHFQRQPNSKGAIILNSIAAVKRLTKLFREFLHPLKVEENTSLTGKTNKDKSLIADLVLGTSTIDVGVDFKINFLLFESADAGSFIQRLGRLGRHDSYEKEDGNKFIFDNFTAYALTPKFLVEKLFKGDQPPLEPNSIYDRPYFHNQIRDKYRQINNFRAYYRRWAGVQSVLLSSNQGLNHKTIRSEYAGSREAFIKDCQQVFGTSLGKVRGCIKKWKEEWQELSGNKTGNPIAEDASSFRGSSGLQCSLYDLTEKNIADRFKTYELPGILSNLEIEPITEVEFMRRLRETTERINQPIPKGRFEHCLAFMELKDYREERLNWRFTYSGDLRAIADSAKVQVLLGVQVMQEPATRWIYAINKRLKERGLVSYIIQMQVDEAKKCLQLPMHFQIYPIDEAGRDDAAAYSVAFGQSALLLDTLACRRKSSGGEAWIC